MSHRHQGTSHAQPPFVRRSSSALAASTTSTPPATASTRSPLIAGRFEVLGLIGVGGMGSVYRARDVTLDEMVALKVIAREIAREPGMLERFRREVKLARRVTHPNVARCFDIGEDGDDRFFTMELVDGESLGSRLLREQRLTADATVSIAIEVCEGLRAAHRAGVVHRDLKPDNVLLATDGRIVLTDFGIASARLPNDGVSRTVGIIVGTPEYMAPEQVEGVRDIDGRADIYSLGAMMFELVTGTPAWTGPTSLAIVAARLALAPPDPRQYVDIGDDLAELILRCMARRREDRFADVGDLAAALRQLPDGPSAARPIGSSPPLREDPRGFLRDKSVMVVARADEDDLLAQAVAAGLADLVERHMRGATTLRVVAGKFAWRAPGASEASSPSSAADVARARDASLVLDTTIALAGQSVAVDVNLINVIDDVVLSSRQYTAPRSDLFAVAASIARDVAEMLLAGHTPTLPGGIADAEALDLWLRARVEGKTGAPYARDSAIALFERAMSRTPNDLWILASYAATLLDRFRETESPSSDLTEALGMAERAIRGSDLLGEAWLARATARFELGDPCGSVTDLARASRIMPAYAHAHALRGRALLEVGSFERSRRDLERALSLDATLVHPRLQLALVAGMTSAFADANAIVDEVLERDSTSADAWLVAARLALWNGDAVRARALRADLGRQNVEQSERAAYVLDAASGSHAGDALDFFAWLAEVDPAAPRRSATARQIEAELAAARGDLARSISAIDAAGATRGFVDVGWLDGCPLLEPLRGAARFVEIRAEIAATARDVLEILDATGEKP